jgi:RNA polymerase sigma-70 factor (ECF subfamily)
MTAQAHCLALWLLMADSLRAPFESNLIQRARRGDPSALEELVRSHQNRIYNLAYRMLRRREDAEDITQEAFLKALEALPRLRDAAAFSSWLNRITANLCLAKLRSPSSGAEITVDPFALAESKENPGDWEDSFRLAALRRAIADLPAPYRLALTAFYLEGHSYEEAARLAGVSPRTLKTRLYRARKLLRRLLAQNPAADLEPTP